MKSESASLRSKILDQIPGIVHGFGTLAEPIPAPFLPLWESHCPIHKQVHKTGIGEIESSHQQAGEVDALFSRSANIPIGVMTADCVPILLAHESGKAVAAVHAGWRGTFARILHVLWSKLKEQGESPQEWVAVIGPSIGPCCYEVSPELAENFIRQFHEIPAETVNPKPRILDLPDIQAAELQNLGVRKIEILRHCTRCSIQPLFHSYRREGGGTRQWSMIMRSTDQDS
jgi:YfiH family protein